MAAAIDLSGGYISLHHWKRSEFFESEKSSLCASVDLLNSIDTDLKANIGLEYVFADMISLRTGYRINYDETSFSAGAGVKLKLGGIHHIAINYCYTDFGMLDNLQRISMVIIP